MRALRVLLHDILEAIDEIAKYTPSTLAEFRADAPIQSHVSRHIAIIGEAASRLPRLLRDANPAIPWQEIIAMRNVVIHVYHGINWDRVYETARTDVPVLRPLIEAMLSGLPPDPVP